MKNLAGYAFQGLYMLKTVSIDQELYNSSPNAFAYSSISDSGWIWLDPNPAKISGKTATVKAKTVKKKAVTLAASKVYKVSPSTGVNAVKVSGNKNITVNKSNGSITVKKKTKKGTY